MLHVRLWLLIVVIVAVLVGINAFGHIISTIITVLTVHCRAVFHAHDRTPIEHGTDVF